MNLLLWRCFPVNLLWYFLKKGGWGINLQELQKYNVCAFEWPADSPDVNPIESKWNISKKNLKKIAQKKLSQLWEHCSMFEWNLNQHLCKANRIECHDISQFLSRSQIVQPNITFIYLFHKDYRSKTYVKKLAWSNIFVTTTSYLNNNNKTENNEVK